MGNEENSLRPFLSHVEPILAVRDIPETILYWQDVLGFPAKWTWGEPPNHAGVSWDGVFIQFSLNPKLASVSRENAIFIRVRYLELLYDFHKNKNAEIVESLENKPWGMAGYTVREINGYYLIFAGDLIADREKSAATMPSTIKIIARTPTVSEYQHLASAIGWSLVANDVKAEMILGAALFAVVAEDELTRKVIGSALLLGDNASFYYVKDVMVHPEWQSKRIGTALMQEINHWLDINGANNALVSLISREGLAPFYQQFGFVQTFGMIKYIQRNK